MNKAIHRLILPALVLAALGGASINAQSDPADRLDAEIRELVARVYPAFVLIGGGSGVCISDDGYFLTNHHVWTGAAAHATMPVRMAGNSRRFIAESVGADPRGDIVLGKLRLIEGEKVPFVTLGDSDKVVRGDICLSIGNPFLLAGTGSEPTVTLGTVTANHRFQGGYNDSIQIDTPINPGNSGGPSFNIHGEVIGINGRNIANHGKRFNTGAGFAIPSNQIANFLDAFKAREGGAYVVRHGFVGGLSLDMAGRGAGASVTAVEPDSEAADAGFQPGDLILEMDGKRVSNGYRYFGIVGTKPRGSQFTFKVRRGDATVEITARNDVPTDAGQFSTIPRPADTPAAGPQANQFRLPPLKSALGIAHEINADRAARGLRVTGFVESPLEEAGLAVGDIITHINGRPIHYQSDLTDILIAVEPNTEVTVRYLRVSEIGEAVNGEVSVRTKAAPPPPRTPPRRRR